MNFTYITAAIALIPNEVSRWLEPLLMIVMALMGVAAIVCILMQKGTNDNIGSLGGSERDTDTYAGKNKGRNRDSILKKLTIVFLVLLMVISIVYFIVLQ